MRTPILTRERPHSSAVFAVFVFAVVVGAAVGCAFSSKDRGSSGAGGSSAATGLGGWTGAVGQPSAPDAGPPPPSPPALDDFPASPIVDPSAPTDAPGLFDGATARGDGAPCISAPAPGTLMPRNWLRPRFEYAALAGENLFEITLTVAGFAHPLRIFTATTSHALDGELWDRLRTSVNGRAITVTVRGLVRDGSGGVSLGPSAPATTSFVVAPVDAPGKIVYWALSDDLGTKVGSLKGFGIGEESVQTVLVPSQVQSPSSGGTCIGCHAATPDGDGVGFSMGPTNYFNNVSDVRSGSAGATPSYITPAAQAKMQSLHGIPAYSKAHWSPGDRIVLLSDTGTLNWVQVDGDAAGQLSRIADTGKATEPTFSTDGKSVVYVSGHTILDGRLGDGPADIYSIPYANRTGGGATPLPGASDAGYTEYYPAFSPDDRFIAFTRIAGSGSSYSNSQAEVMVVPWNGGAGGTAVRLAANDAPACQTTLRSPGLTNDWPKWSPHAVTGPDGKTYYWLTFSSKRTASTNAQLYITGLVVDGTGAVTTYPALYLWNQPAADGNHTPAWDDFAIPPIVVGAITPRR
jgi:hypothetical protein